MPSRKEIVEKYISSKNKEKLLPCPFCGGAGAYTYRPSTNGVSAFAKVECQSCGALVGLRPYDLEELIREVAIAKWNQRIGNEVYEYGKEITESANS